MNFHPLLHENFFGVCDSKFDVMVRWVQPSFYILYSNFLSLVLIETILFLLLFWVSDWHSSTHLWDVFHIITVSTEVTLDSLNNTIVVLLGYERRFFPHCFDILHSNFLKWFVDGVWILMLINLEVEYRINSKLWWECIQIDSEIALLAGVCQIVVSYLLWRIFNWQLVLLSLVIRRVFII